MLRLATCSMPRNPGPDANHLPTCRRAMRNRPLGLATATTVTAPRQDRRVSFTVDTVNVNGLRAAVRKGMHDWLADAAPDVVTLQEVGAPDDLVAELLGEGWHVAHDPSITKGRAGV